MNIKMTVMAAAAAAELEGEEEDTGQSTETTNIKMAAMAKAVPVRREEADLRKMVAEEALICLRVNEGPIILQEVAWVLQEIGAGRTCHEEVDHRAIPQVSLAFLVINTSTFYDQFRRTRFDHQPKYPALTLSFSLL
jgi:hypothetical protein